MPRIAVAGGFYVETCIQPLWNEIFGSGGRAAAALSGLGVDVDFHTYVSAGELEAAESFATHYGINLAPATSLRNISFSYLHPLSTPSIVPAVSSIAPLRAMNVSAPVALRYGMLEGDAVITADTAVYDPQSAFEVPRFRANGSSAKRLAVVLNRTEARRLTQQDQPDNVIRWIFDNDGAEVVVLKMGPEGALVASKSGSWKIPVYESEFVWKIGSGDVFSAAFTYFWAIQELEPAAAADYASKATARFCATRRLPILKTEELDQLTMRPVLPAAGRIYLAGPFFDLGQRWLIEEAREKLRDLGAEVFSPIHDVGPGSADVIAKADLDGLEGSMAVLAIANGMDPGTIFEIGYATKKKIPIVVLAQNTKDEDLKMIAGSGAKITDDFCTAIYWSVWALRAK